jgi:hypothetical protein
MTVLSPVSELVSGNWTGPGEQATGAGSGPKLRGSKRDDSVRMAVPRNRVSENPPEPAIQPMVAQ